MYTHSMLSLAIAVPIAMAFPSMPGNMVRREENQNCPETNGRGDLFISDIEWFEDKDCTKRMYSTCVYGEEGIVDAPEGSWICGAAGTPDITPFYGRVLEADYESMQLVFTRDQSCPPNGPGAVFATFINNRNCVMMNMGGEAVGLTVFPKGGSGLSRLAAPEDLEEVPEIEGAPVEEKSIEKIRKRNTNCDGFVIESQTPSYSESVQVSNVIDCLNGGDNGCSIDVTQTETKSVTSSFSLSLGGSISSGLNFGTTFGTEYTNTTSTSLQEGFSIPGGQKGYLSAYCSATLFKGKWTGCDEGDDEQEGSALVMKDKAFTYAIVLTGSKKN